MPRYMFLLFDDETRWANATEDQISAAMALHNDFSAAVQADGATVLGGEALQASHTATVVRPRRDADAQVTDGPFAELKEALGGYYVLECSDLDQALRLAAQCPSAAIEVRPVWEVGG
ncbi:MAG: YciI family protein [Actinomycetes bacterium]